MGFVDIHHLMTSNIHFRSLHLWSSRVHCGHSVGILMLCLISTSQHCYEHSRYTVTPNTVNVFRVDMCQMLGRSYEDYRRGFTHWSSPRKTRIQVRQLQCHFECPRIQSSLHWRLRFHSNRVELERNIKKSKWRRNVMNMMALLTYLQQNVTLNMPPTWCCNGKCGQTYLLTNTIVRGMHDASVKNKMFSRRIFRGKKNVCWEWCSPQYVEYTISMWNHCAGIRRSLFGQYLTAHLYTFQPLGNQSITSFSQKVWCSMTACVKCWFPALELSKTEHPKW